jgi:mono/diheme cytochrome c family protein
MMLIRTLLSILVIVSMLDAISVSAEESDQSEMDGRELYMTFQCWQCHGYEGQGGAAARLATKDYPFEAFEQFVRRPNLMPAYTSELLSDEKLRIIYEFVRSIPEPAVLGDIPALGEK